PPRWTPRTSTPCRRRWRPSRGTAPSWWSRTGCTRWARPTASSSSTGDAPSRRAPTRNSSPAAAGTPATGANASAPRAGASPGPPPSVRRTVRPAIRQGDRPLAIPEHVRKDVPATGGGTGGRPGLTLAAVAVVQFMVSLDLSVVNVGLPEIAAGLGFGEVGL